MFASFQSSGTILKLTDLLNSLVIDWSAYKRKRNQVNNRVKYDKRKYYRGLLESNASEPRKFWKTIKEVFPINSLTKHTTSSLKIDEVKTLNDHDTENVFCSFFCEIAKSLKSAALPLMNFVWKYKPKNHNNTVRRFNFKQVQVSEVFKNLKNLSRKKSIGLDDVPFGLFKDAASVIARPLTHIINLSLSNWDCYWRLEKRQNRTYLQIRIN